MFYLYFISMTAVFSSLQATMYRSEREVDIFIDKLLTSAKFEKIADRIAEKAADKIMNLQHHSQTEEHEKTSELSLPAYPNLETRFEERDNKGNIGRLPFFDRENQHHHDEGKKEDNEAKKALRQREPSNDSKEKESKESFKLAEPNTAKAKIDTVAAIQKFAKFPTEELSLNFKHFTTRNVPKYTAVAKKKLAADETEESVRHQRKLAKRSRPSGAYKRVDEAMDETESTTVADIHKDDSDLSDDDKQGSDSDQQSEAEEETSTKILLKESDEHVHRATETTKKPKKDKKHKKSKKKLTETSSVKSVQQVKLKSDEVLRMKTEEITSDDNKVVPVEDKENKHDKHDSHEKNEKHDSHEKHDKHDSHEKHDKHDSHEKHDKHDSHEKHGKHERKIDFRHMVREENGKIFAFEQSPDYEEYHEKLTSFLKSVQDKTRRKYNIE